MSRANRDIRPMRRPRLSDVTACARALRRGTRLAVVEVALASDGEDEPIAHATAAYSIVTPAPPPR